MYITFFNINTILYWSGIYFLFVYLLLWMK